MLEWPWLEMSFVVFEDMISIVASRVTLMIEGSR
jgi:hypothetical protein